ncbi:MAG: ABC transporter permease [Candidatus Scalinduaceae bacterium]
MKEYDPVILDVVDKEPKLQSQEIDLKTVEQSKSVFSTNQLRELWRYRELIVGLFWTTLKLRYAGSVLGIIWSIVNPILYIATYWVVFSYIIRMGLSDYPLFLIPGFLAWNFTLVSLLSASESIINGKHLITKIAFPIEILTLVSVAVYLFDFLVALSLYLLVVVILPPTLPLTVVALPLVIIIQILFTTGLAMLIACGSVFFRDIPKLLPILGNIFFFLTPIFYPLNIVPEPWRLLIQLNPMTQIITFYHELLYVRIWPQSLDIGFAFLVAISLLVLGLSVFNLLKHRFAELS